MPNLGERLTELQVNKNVLKKDVAKAIKISVMAYYRYEVGERQPTADVLIKMSQYFNVSVDYLLGLTDNPLINK